MLIAAKTDRSQKTHCLKGFG